VSTLNPGSIRRLLLPWVAVAAAFVVASCSSDSGVSTSVGVSYGYGGYYGPGWYGGYYDPYPPVVVVPPDNRPERPNKPDGGNRPTTLPAEVGGGPSSMAATRPSNVSRPTSRPSPRPAPRPMPAGGRRR